MVDQFIGKKVPWRNFEQYLDTHKKFIAPWIVLLEGGTDKDTIEKQLPKSFFRLHETITKTLKEQNILQNKDDFIGNQIELIVQTVMKLQNSLITHNIKS